MGFCVKYIIAKSFIMNACPPLCEKHSIGASKKTTPSGAESAIGNQPRATPWVSARGKWFAP